MPGRKPGYCMPGMQLFAARHGLKMRELVDGIDEERLLDTGDAMAIKIVEYARMLNEGKA